MESDEVKKAIAELDDAEGLARAIANANYFDANAWSKAKAIAWEKADALAAIRAKLADIKATSAE